jgi:hypothetical protein
VDPRTKDELLAENNELRQLLQAGVMLANAVLAGDDVTDDLQTWLAAVNAFFASQQP